MISVYITGLYLEEVDAYDNNVVLFREVRTVEATDQILVMYQRLLLRFGILRDVVSLRGKVLMLMFSTVTVLIVF